MSATHSSETVTYRSLDFLGFPDYRVGDDGSVWSRFPSGCSKLSREDVQQVRERYAAGDVSQQDLVIEFGCTQAVISRIARGILRKDERWKRLSAGRHPKKGHLLVHLHNAEGKKSFWAHRLVLMAFVGPCPDGMEGCHNDGDPANNRLDNLRWDTKEANEADRNKHGTDNRGARHGMSKLTEEQVLEMRRLYDFEGWRLCDLVKRFGVSIGCVHSIVHRETWKHLP